MFEAKLIFLSIMQGLLPPRSNITGVIFLLNSNFIKLLKIK
ncbi:hypothetical protein SAMN05421842_10439 [Clostridium uliginosum]|uniref:Uncharacterized protein n=1 Tax=Clostridium uliginosum TaxID=119641 RepID=A0A1I1JIT7_9CLOT|nr:hypothetical protein SAMN05421842_10439 [Clostridium uliginosum]